MHRSIALLTALFACGALAQTAPAAPAQTAPAPATSDAQALEAQYDALFQKRDQPGVLHQLHQVLDKGLTAHPNDFGFNWRAADLIEWEADGTTDSHRKQALGAHCWTFGDKAAKENATAVQGYYLGAACVGAYSEAVGILTALRQGLESKFNDRLDKAIQLDPKFKHCGPLIAKARYYYKLPWPKHDYDKSEELFKKALTLCPESLRARLWLAETQADNDHAKQALANVNMVLAGSIDYDPPEGRRVKAMVPAVKKKVEDELK